MRLASVTITNRRDDMIVDALRSVVDMVDMCVVVSTHGAEYDYTHETALCGDKLRKASIAPIVTPADTARARNDAIEAARAAGADWVVLVDTDERFHWGETTRAQVEEVLATPGAESFIIRAHEAFYSKDKFLRPGTGQFEGLAHEAWVPRDPSARKIWHPGPRFSELPKDPQALRKRDRAVVRVLKEALKADPQNPRSHFYLGESYTSLGKIKLAERHYMKCVASKDQHWAEEASWAAYKCGIFRMHRGELQTAIRAFAISLMCYPATAEAACAAAICAGRMKRAQDVIAWANMAVANGAYSGAHAFYQRMHFRDVTFLYEMPFECLRAAFHALGQADRAAESVRAFRDAYQTRIAREGGPQLPDTDWRLHRDTPEPEDLP